MAVYNNLRPFGIFRAIRYILFSLDMLYQENWQLWSQSYDLELQRQRCKNLQREK
jgi:hypothetical protein